MGNSNDKNPERTNKQGENSTNKSAKSGKNNDELDEEQENNDESARGSLQTLQKHMDEHNECLASANSILCSITKELPSSPTGGNSTKAVEMISELIDKVYSVRSSYLELEQVFNNTLKPYGYSEKEVLQIFSLHSEDLINAFQTELLSTLRMKLTNVTFRKCRCPSDIDQQKLVIVLSIVTTRVGADAKYAIKDIKCLEKTILLLIHCKDVHSISGKSSAIKLDEQQFGRLYGIVDVAFTKESGIYQCEMNDTNLTKLSSLYEMS